MATFGPIVGYVSRFKDNIWACRVVVETLTPKIEIDIQGPKVDTLLYRQFPLGQAYIHRFIVQGLLEDTIYTFRFGDKECMLRTPKKDKEISIYALSCDGMQNYNFYKQNARDFHGLKEGDDSLWDRLNNDIKNQDNFVLTLHIGDNFYCDDIYKQLLQQYTFEENKITEKGTVIEEQKILGYLQENYRKIYKKKKISVGSHLFMNDDHEVYDDFGDSQTNISDGTIMNKYLIDICKKMYKYYQFILYEDPDTFSSGDIYIDDYRPLGIAIPDLRGNRQYISKETKYPILAKEQMDDLKAFFCRKELQSMIICFSIPLTLMNSQTTRITNLLMGTAADGWGASQSRVNQRDEILQILSTHTKLAIIGGDLHYGMMSYLTNEVSVIPTIITSGISSYPPTGMNKLVYPLMSLFQPRVFGNFYNSAIQQINDFNYLKMVINKEWNFSDKQTFKLKTYLRRDKCLTIEYTKSYSWIYALLSTII